jgi:hypothetical protein
MLKYSTILAGVLVLLISCLFFVPQWFHSEQNISLNTGYLVLGIPTAIVALLFGIHIWKQHASRKFTMQANKDLHAYYGDGTKVRAAPADVLNSMNIYHDISIRNYWSYRVLGIISLASSLFLAVALGSEISVAATKILAFVSSLSTGIIFSFNLVEKSNRARRAFRVLLNAVMLYQHGQIEIKELLERYSQAEDLLGDDEFKSGAAGNTPAGK